MIELTDDERRIIVAYRNLRSDDMIPDAIELLFVACPMSHDVYLLIDRDDVHRRAGEAVMQVIIDGMSR